MAKAERNGSRKGRDEFAKRRTELGYYFIVTDTEETEENYLLGLKASLPEKLQSRITIRVIKTKTSKLVERCLEEASMLPNNAQKWIVFDRDQVEDFDKIIREAKANDIKAGWSNPCIEIWFDAYFGSMHGEYQTSVLCCEGFGKTFERQTGRKYVKSDKQLYALLYQHGDEKKAVELAERRYKQHKAEGKKKPSEMCPCTTLHRLVAEIREKTDGEKQE